MRCDVFYSLQLARDLESVINSENGGKCDPTDSFMLFDTVRAFMAMGKQLPEGWVITDLIRVFGPNL